MTSDAAFPIVCIGASAGAVEALEGFFRGMPEKPGLACVIITHLSPNRDSMLPESVSRFTSMSVHAITENSAIEIDCVYLLPTDAVVSISNRRRPPLKDALTRSVSDPGVVHGALPSSRRA